MSGTRGPSAAGRGSSGSGGRRSGPGGVTQGAAPPGRGSPRLEHPDHERPGLLPTLGLGALILYGVGDMLGSGIYALIGKVAGAMGSACWLAFLVSMVAALLTGLSYASLGSRYPRAAGAAYVTQRAFGRPFLAYLVGLAVMASGLTSMATQSRTFTGYISALLPGLPDPAWVVLFIAALTLVNVWGMKESTWLNVVCTTVEVSGLAIVILVGLRYLGRVSYLEPPTVEGVVRPLGLSMVFQGAVLTFYSFIGFEDMINVVEEVKDPVRTFPRGVLGALAVVTVIYLLVSLVAVSVVPHAELALSKEPLVEVVRRSAPWFPSAVFSGIALFAITNTALLNYIMGSRLAYGMSRDGLLPRWLGAVHPARHTPHRATLVLAVVVLVLALSGEVAQLAKATSVLLLSVFCVINVALVVLQRRPGEPRGTLEVPAAVPVGGLLVCASLLMHAKRAEVLTALILAAAITALYLVLRPRRVAGDAEDERSPIGGV
ncbi:MAG: amino acid permease [Armatimonadetes bacterium]|nr:amino acid permease [Armatimonadota bacterium]